MVSQLAEDVIDRGTSDELIGHEDAGVAKASRNLNLMRRGEGHAPSAVLQLEVEKRGAHGRLAVRSDPRVAVPQKGLHPRTIVSKGALLQHGNREGKVFPQ